MKLLSLILPGGQTIQTPSGVPTGGLDDKGGIIIRNGISLFILIGILMALFFTIYSGIQWTMSGGDKQKLQAARNRLTFSIIGLIIMFLALFIVNIIGGLFGVDLGTSS